jgi:hypothetical protein
VRLALELGKKEAADSPEDIHSRARDNRVDFSINLISNN